MSQRCNITAEDIRTTNTDL